MIVRPRSILLDAEALSALARRERRMHAWAEVARRTDSILYASTATLSEITDGTSADARLRHTVKSLVRLVDVTEQIGYRAGPLRTQAAKARRKARDLTVDALVAATATTLTPPAVVLTCDSDDLNLLLATDDVLVEKIS